MHDPEASTYAGKKPCNLDQSQKLLSLSTQPLSERELSLNKSVNYENKLGAHKTYLLLRNYTINSTTTSSSANKLNYDGAQAMDVTGRDRHGSLVRVRPLEGNSEEEYRTVGQDMRYTLK